MSKSSIPARIQNALWARAAGVCEYRGCQEGLVGDLISGKEDGTFGFLAHIVADLETGPRGDPVRSKALSRSLDNLMVLCSRHHKLIDVDEVDAHPEPLLLEMKREHEARIELLCGIDEDRASHVVRFAANIGENEALVSTRSIFAAMPPDRHPAERHTIDLDLIGSAFADHEPEYWAQHRTNLRRLFAQRVKERVERGEIRHLSVFALAPQPLLIELGRLLCDIVPSTVHQRTREPASWAWPRDREPVRYVRTQPPAQGSGAVALKLAVSATVIDDRIKAVLGDDVAIWSLCAEEPGNDVVRRPEDQSAYRTALRRLYDDIKAVHGENAVIHVFPALPNSLAVETGRAWMPKSDLPLCLYDNRRERGFTHAFDLENATLTLPT